MEDDAKELMREIMALTIVMTPLIRQRREDPNVQAQVEALTNETCERSTPEEADALRRSVRLIMER